MGALDVSPLVAGPPHFPLLKPVELLRRLRDPAPPVAGLLLDVAGVLYDDTIWSLWLFKLLTRIGLHTNYTPFFRVWEREYGPRIKRGEFDYWQALGAFLRSAGLSKGQVDEVEAAGHARQRDFETNLLPLPGVVHSLTRLQRMGIQITALSGGHLTAPQLAERLTRLGLARFISTVLTEMELGQARPNESCFEVAVAVSGLLREQLCYVGRSAPALADATAAGLRTVAVNYDEDAEADIFLGHFEQLLDSLPWEAAGVKVG
jgi:FMN phosphatase YigB (HAD superfamily)